MSRPTSAQTYRITHALRGFSRTFPLRTAEAGVRLRLERHDPESYMKWALVVGSSTYASTLVMFDPRKQEVWVRAPREEDREIVAFLTAELHRMLGGFLAEQFAEQGYRLVAGSTILATTMTGKGRLE